MVTRSRKTLPCAACGELMWRGTGSLTDGTATCRPCRQKGLGSRYRKTRRGVPAHHLGFCGCCTTPFKANSARKKYCSVQCANHMSTGQFKRRLTPEQRRANLRATQRRRTHIRREKTIRVRDLTIGAEIEMRKKARKCRLCRCWMTDKPYLPNSKELDHIVPLVMGGTHTFGNVRVICKTCNVSRTKDGSDFVGPVTLWAQASELDGLPLITKTRRKRKPPAPKDPSTVGWGPKKGWVRDITWYRCRFCGCLGYERKRNGHRAVCEGPECRRRLERQNYANWMRMHPGLQAERQRRGRRDGRLQQLSAQESA